MTRAFKYTKILNTVEVLMCLKVKRILLQDWRLRAQEQWQSSHQPSDIKDIPGDISTYTALKASLGEEVTGQAPAGALLVAVFEMMRQRLCTEGGEGLLVQTHLLFCHVQRQGDHWKKHKALLQLQLHLSTRKNLSKRVFLPASSSKTRLGPEISCLPRPLLRERSHPHTLLPKSKSANAGRSLVSLLCLGEAQVSQGTDTIPDSA